MEMNLTAARKMITVAQSRAAEIGVRATIVVVDHGGDPVATSDDADDSSDDASDDRSDDAMTTAESSRRDGEKRSPEFRRTNCASLATSAVGCLPC
ncbi:heme-binding protein (plasmid) [Rhizobium leguminosarum bv. viciae]|nr:heme-binding protein [Rhizobium leguminosarum bv. viciae]